MIRHSFHIFLLVILFHAGLPVAWSQTAEQREERQRLMDEVAARKSALEKKRSEHFVVRDDLVKQGSNLEQRMKTLEQRKLELDALNAERDARTAQKFAPILAQPVNPFDTFAFTSGRVISCSVVSFKDGEFLIEDADRNSMHVLGNTVQSIVMRTNKEAIVFPPHVVHQQAASRAHVRNRPAIPPPPDISMTGHNMDLKTIWMRSKKSDGLGPVGSDPDKWEVKFVLFIDPLGLIPDVKKTRAQIWVFAEDSENPGHMKLLLHTDKTVNLSAIQKMEIETGTVKLAVEDAGGPVHGFNVFGYVVEIADSKGNVFITHSNSQRLLNRLENIRKISVKDSIQL